MLTPPSSIPGPSPIIPSVFASADLPAVRAPRAPATARTRSGGPPNRRREMRRAARLGCIVRRADTWRLVGDRTIDLSAQGMLVLSDEDLDRGVELVVSFQATDLPIWFDTLATVTRVADASRLRGTPRALGVQFDSLPAVSRLILRGYVRKLPAPSSRRDPRAAPAPKDPDYAQIVADIRSGRI